MCVALRHYRNLLREGYYIGEGYAHTCIDRLEFQINNDGDYISGRNIDNIKWLLDTDHYIDNLLKEINEEYIAILDTPITSVDEDKANLCE